MSNVALALDHLVLAAPTLDAGTAWAKAHLGATPSGGGQHAGAATHNRLLALGDCYLEVIARDPAAVATRTRWFGLDDPEWAPDAPTEPRLITWVLRTNDLDAALRLPGARGVAREATRGPLRWRIGLPDDGVDAVRRGLPDIHRMAGRRRTGGIDARQRTPFASARNLPPARVRHRGRVARPFRRRARRLRERRDRIARARAGRAGLGRDLPRTRLAGVIVDQLP